VGESNAQVDWRRRLASNEESSPMLRPSRSGTGGSRIPKGRSLVPLRTGCRRHVGLRFLARKRRVSIPRAHSGQPASNGCPPRPRIASRSRRGGGSGAGRTRKPSRATPLATELLTIRIASRCGPRTTSRTWRPSFGGTVTGPLLRGGRPDQESNLATEIRSLGSGGPPSGAGATVSPGDRATGGQRPCGHSRER